MTTSLAKVYARNLMKEEAKVYVDIELKKKEERLSNSQTNTIGKTILKSIAIPLTFICWPVGLGTFLCVCNYSWYQNYKIGIRISNRMAEELEKNIPLYLYMLSESFNKGIESLKIMKEKYIDIYNSNSSISIP